MRPIPTRRWAPLIAWALLTPLAIGWLAPPAAEGGCDHPGDRPKIAGDLFPGESASVEHGPMPVPKPCTGPQCSGKAAIPVPPASATTPHRPELCCPAGTHDASTPAGSYSRVNADAAGSAVSIPSPVFHPPRPTS